MDFSWLKNGAPKFLHHTILTYKLIEGKEGISHSKFFKMANVRGDPEIARGKKIYRERSNLDKRKYCFSQRAPIKWNSLSKREVDAVSTSVFKKEFDLAEPSRVGTRYTSTRSWIQEMLLIDRVFDSVFPNKMVRHGNGLLQAFKLRQLISLLSMNC